MVSDSHLCPSPHYGVWCKADEQRTARNQFAPADKPFSTENLGHSCSQQISKLREKEERNKHSVHDFSVPSMVPNAYLCILHNYQRRRVTDNSAICRLEGGSWTLRQQDPRLEPAPQSIRLSGS